MSVAPPDILLTSLDLARRWSLSVNAIQSMRRRGNGPRFVRLGPKRIRYRLADIAEFEQTFLTLNEAREGSPVDQARAAKQRDAFNRTRPKALRVRLMLAAKRRAAAERKGSKTGGR